MRLTGLNKKANIFLRVVGKDRTGVPPVIAIPTVGLAHDYLETLEALVYGDRQVITFDPVGVGQSSRDLPAGLAEAEGVTEEEALLRWSRSVVEVLRSIVEFLELESTDLHLLGHGAGAIPALQFAAEVTEGRVAKAAAASASSSSSPVGGIKSLTLASPFVLGGKAIAKSYTAAGKTVPICVSEAVDGSGKLLAQAERPEAVFDGRFVSMPAVDKLAGIPTFVSYGSNEPMGEKEAQRIAARVASGGAETETEALTVVKAFEGTALPHVDVYEAYTDWLDELLQRSEGKMRPV